MAYCYEARLITVLLNWINDWDCIMEWEVKTKTGLSLFWYMQWRLLIWYKDLQSHSLCHHATACSWAMVQGYFPSSTDQELAIIVPGLSITPSWYLNMHVETRVILCISWHSCCMQQYSPHGIFNCVPALTRLMAARSEVPCHDERWSPLPIHAFGMWSFPVYFYI